MNFKNIIIAVFTFLLVFTNSNAAQFEAKNNKTAVQTLAQNNQSKKVEPKENTKKSDSQVKYETGTEVKKNSLIKEEIQRYLGFETLFTRYITIPYDITMNVNVAGYYIDIGYLILMFLPIILIVGLKTKPIYGYLTMLVAMLFLIISTSNGIMVKNKFNRLSSNKENLKLFSSENEVDSPIDLFVSEIYYTFEVIAKPVNNFIDNTFSGNYDYVTYPILILAFVFLFFIIDTRLKNTNQLLKLLALITLLFIFLWILFAAGIIWYGYLLMPMSILFIFKSIYKNRKTEIFNKVLYTTLITISIIWILQALILRTSNIYKTGEDIGIHFLDMPVVKYQTGMKNEKNKQFGEEDVINNYFIGLNRNNALKKLNANHNYLILSAGSMFPYFIEKNDERLIMDNLLGLFERLRRRYRNKETIARSLRASNIKFILINLNLHKIDKTPEKSVEKKYINFMNFIYQNEQLNLLATDRVLTKEENGRSYFDYGVFGDIKSSGTYAIYEIK